VHWVLQYLIKTMFGIYTARGHKELSKVRLWLLSHEHAACCMHEGQSQQARHPTLVVQGQQLSMIYWSIRNASDASDLQATVHWCVVD